MSGDWLAGYGGGYVPRSPRPVEQRKAPPAPPEGGTGKSDDQSGWRKGQTRVSALVACCPECGHDRIKIRTPLGATLVQFQCRRCGHEWKDARCDRLV